MYQESMQRPSAETSLGSWAVSIFHPCASQRSVPKKALSTIISNVVGTCCALRDNGTAKPFNCFPLYSRERGTSCMYWCLTPHKQEIFLKPGCSFLNQHQLYTGLSTKKPPECGW